MSKSKYKFQVVMPWTSLRPLVTKNGIIEEPNSPLFWCREKWGPGNNNNWRSKFNNDEELEITFTFVREEDALIFSLRWL